MLRNPLYLLCFDTPKGYLTIKKISTIQCKHSGYGHDHFCFKNGKKNEGESSFMIVLKTVAHRLFTDKGCRADLC